MKEDPAHLELPTDSGVVHNVTRIGRQAGDRRRINDQPWHLRFRMGTGDRRLGDGSRFAAAQTQLLHLQQAFLQLMLVAQHLAQ